MADSGSSRLEDFAPEGLTPEGPGWQRQKSAQARVAILEAAIHCLEKYGYAETTTQLIAKIAGISRGAMLHHYATKQDLIASVLDYTVYKRAERFLSAIAGLTDEQRTQQMVGIELYWQSIQTPEFAAYFELQCASRTDSQLRPIFVSKARRLDRLWRDTIFKAFPEWTEAADRHDLAMDYVIATMEGLLLNKEIWNDQKRRQHYRQFVGLTVRMLREGKISLSQLPPISDSAPSGGRSPQRPSRDGAYAPRRRSKKT